jgi:hypothetical protein
MSSEESMASQYKKWCDATYGTAVPRFVLRICRQGHQVQSRCCLNNLGLFEFYLITGYDPWLETRSHINTRFPPVGVEQTPSALHPEHIQSFSLLPPTIFKHNLSA